MHYLPGNSLLLRERSFLRRILSPTLTILYLAAVLSIVLLFPNPAVAPILLKGSLIALGVWIVLGTFRNYQTEQHLRLQLRQGELLGNIAQRIRQSLNVEQVLTTTVAEVRQLLQCDRVLIYQLQPDYSGRIIAESVSTSTLSILGRTIHDPCFSERLYESYRNGRVSSLVDRETANLHPCHAKLLASLEVRANLVLPILHGETLWGLLIAHHCTASRLWETWEIDLLRKLSEQLAIAIQQSELYRQVQQLNSNLGQQVEQHSAELEAAVRAEATLKRITDRVRDTLDEDHILQSVVRELTLGMELVCCNTAIFDLENGISTICYEYPTALHKSQKRVSRIEDFPELYNPLLKGEYFQFCSLLPNPNRGRAAMLACPIQDDQGVLGDLWLVNQADCAFTEQDIRLVQQVANQCAIALRQARLYEAAQQQVRELGRLNQLKDDFLSTVSHELRTPIANIRVAVQMLEIIFFGQKEASPDGKEGSVLIHPSVFSRATRYFDILKSECQREITLINDLLDLSQLDDGNVTLEVTTQVIRPWLLNLVAPFFEQTRQQDQSLEIAISEDLPALTTDFCHLEPVLVELLHNACKYTPGRETIAVAVQNANNHVELRVSNSGVEISSSELPRIFDKFYRIPNNDPWKHGGTGLGLALVRKRLTRLHGTIEVSSQNGWTAFTVRLPWQIELTKPTTPANDRSEQVCVPDRSVRESQEA